MPTFPVLDANGNPVELETPNANGRASAAASRPVALSTEDLAALAALATTLGEVAASPTANTVLDRLKTISASLTTVSGNVDGLEPLSTALNGFVDGLETLVGTTNSSLSTQAGYLDGLEGLATTLNSYVDGLEAQTGGVTETAPASDTASSGLNGRLQRIAQRVTALIALLPASLGSKAASASLSVVQGGLEYEPVAASQTAQAIGATGAIGDFLSHVIIQPLTTAAGTVVVYDNAIAVYTFTAGTLGDLRPITVPIGAFSTSGAWKITTGANVTVTPFGDFT